MAPRTKHGQKLWVMTSNFTPRRVVMNRQINFAATTRTLATECLNQFLFRLWFYFSTKFPILFPPKKIRVFDSSATPHWISVANFASRNLGGDFRSLALRSPKWLQVFFGQRCRLLFSFGSINPLRFHRIGPMANFNAMFNKKTFDFSRRLCSDLCHQESVGFLFNDIPLKQLVT